MKTTNTETNTVQATALLSNLLNAVSDYDAALGGLSPLFSQRATALETLRAAGFNACQGGGAVRYNANAEPLKGQYSYAVAIAEFTARFNTAWDSRLTIKQQADRALDDTKHRPTKTQVDNNNKQRVSTLNVWLKTGKFSNNIGKDKARLEHEVSLERVNTLQDDATVAVKTATIAKRQVKENEKILKATPDDVAAAANLKASKVVAAKAAKTATAAKGKLVAAQTAAAVTKDTLNTKNSAAQDMRKVASGLASKFTIAQIKELIDYLKIEVAVL